MKIHMIGQKGIPATFGGVEHHVERLATALVRRGHDVSVYVRPWYTPSDLKTVEGVRLIHLPTLKTKHGDASVHSLLASFRAALSGADIIHYHAIGPGLFSFLPRLFGKTVAVTVHRLDWKTKKWGPLARLSLKAGEFVSVTAPQRTIVVSAELQRYFQERYRRETVLIPHGSQPVQTAAPRLIRARYHLRGRDYVLFMGRFSPEKRVEWLIESFQEMKGAAPQAKKMKLVLAGESSATDDYVRHLKEMAAKNSDIILTGYVTGRDKAELLTNALFFVLPSSLEGSPVVLLEARGYGLCCLASDIAPHRETIKPGRDGLLFRRDDRADLTRKMTRLTLKPEETARMGRQARERSAGLPSWDEVARRHEKLYNEALGLGSGRGAGD